MALLDLTIAIPAKNEEKNLEGCLCSIGPDFARKIVLIDSGSTDGTIGIARRHGVEVVDFRWDGKFPKKRNWWLRNHSPDTKWVLFLDGDEYLTTEFKEALTRALEDDSKDGFWLSYSVYFLGKRLKGGYPMRKLALFRVGKGEYERIDEDHWSGLDMEVHEHPVLAGPVGVIAEKIDHRDFRGVGHYVAKHNEYSSWEAARVLKGAANLETRARWSWRQRLKYRLVRTPLIGPIYFLGSYFLMGGFRDGTAGLAFAILKMGYFTQVYCKLREMEDGQNT